MQAINPLYIATGERFTLLNSDLSYFYNIPRSAGNGAIMLCQGGEADVTIDVFNGKITRNTQVFLLPRSIMMLTNVSADFQVTILAFSRELLDEASYHIHMEFFHFIHKHPVYHCSNEQAEAARNWLQSAFYVYRDKENMFRNIIIKNRLQNILLEIYDKIQRSLELQPEPSSSRKQDLFNKFIALVHDHAPLERGLPFYADKLCLSTRYLSAITRIVANVSAKEIIDRLVVLQIKVMLQSTDQSIQEIADELNFHDQSYLGHYFKKHTGESPSVYRKKNLL